jgi:hypothetical protein
MKGPGILLSEPMTSTERSEVKNPRSSHSDYKNLSDEFLLTNEQRSYQRQFCHIYNARLNAMRSRVSIKHLSLPCTFLGLSHFYKNDPSL